ncbi:MAG TPA: hypothetical protein VGK74_03945 [Symbiobacteriaceae bacterium]
MAAPIADLIQAARTGQVSAGEFDQHLSEIAGQYVNAGLPASEKGRQINLVARIAGLENQLVERLRPGAPPVTGPSVDQMVNDWAARFAEDHGVTLSPPVASPGSLLERRV